MLDITITTHNHYSRLANRQSSLTTTNNTATHLNDAAMSPLVASVKPSSAAIGMIATLITTRSRAQIAAIAQHIARAGTSLMSNCCSTSSGSIDTIFSGTLAALAGVLAEASVRRFPCGGSNCELLEVVALRVTTIEAPRRSGDGSDTGRGNPA